MVNKTVYTMKQPDLGQKILHWRKSKGLTQEELVEKCNLNVRTLQRIEAGDVLPRTYTIKSILNALEVDFSVLQDQQENKQTLKEILKPHRNMLIVASIMGLLYLGLSTIELFLDFKYYDQRGDHLNHVTYSLVKAGVVFTFGLFYYGIFLISRGIRDNLLRFSCLFIIALVMISNTNDVLSLRYDYINDEVLVIIKSIVFGVAYLLMGAAVALAYKKLGKLGLAAGIVGIISGLGFISVILAIPSLIILTVFEVLLLLVIVKTVPVSQADMKTTEFDLST